MKFTLILISLLLVSTNIFAEPEKALNIDTIAYSKTAMPVFFYKREMLTNKAVVKMLDVNVFKKAGLGLRKAKRGYYVNKGLCYLAGLMVSYPFFSALLNKDLYAGPCIMAAGTVLVNVNVSKNYNGLLLSIVKEHNQKIIAKAKNLNKAKDLLNDHVL